MKPLLIILGIWLCLYVLFANEVLINPDGIAHFSYLRSLLFDVDLLFFNEYEHYAFQTGAAYLTPTGHLSNIWSIGPAVLWLPFALLGQLFSYPLEWFGIDVGQAGYSLGLIAFGVKLGSSLLGLLTVWLLYLMGHKLTGRRELYPPLLFLFGTPLVFYSFYWSDLSHVHSVFAVTMFLYVQLSDRDETDPWYWACSGLCFGLMVLVREQNAGFGVLMLPDAYRLYQSGIEKKLFFKNIGLWFVSGFVLLLPQFLAWKVVLGSFWAAPKSANLDWGSFRIVSSLFSTYHGLFVWTPLFLLGLFGALDLFRENKRFGIWLAVAFAIQLIINSNVVNWWASSSFGNRFYLNCLPVFYIFFMSLYRNKRKLAMVLSGVATAYSLYLFLLQAEGTLHLGGYLAAGEFFGLLRSNLSAVPSMLYKIFANPYGQIKAGLIVSLPIAALAFAVTVWFGRVFEKNLEPRKFVLRIGTVLLGLTLVFDGLIAAAAFGAREKASTYRVQAAGMRYHAEDWQRFIKKNSLEIIAKKYIKDGQYDSARTTLERLIRLQPQHAMYPLMLGLMDIQLGRYRQAESVIAGALRMYPNHPEINRYARLLAERVEHQKIALRFSFDQHFNMSVSVRLENL